MNTDIQGMPAYGAQMASYFRLPKAASLLIPRSTKPPLAITRLVSDIGLPELTANIPEEKAFVVSVHLTPASVTGCDIWVDNRHSHIANWPAGGVGIYDLEANPRARNRGPVDWVHYHIPRTTLDAFASDVGGPHIETLKNKHGTVDPVLQQLTELILPSLTAPEAFSQIFLDYFRLLFCAHVTQHYSPSFNTASQPRGGLAPWQKRRVIDLFTEHLDGNLTLPMAAGQCRLSVSHFARAFRRTFGTPPHRYLVLQRVERAKAILSRSDCALSEVSQQTGFSDQAAFTRTFKAAIGITPGQWRRQQRISRFIKEP
jgi:AraC family transcriptional regulator